MVVTDRRIGAWASAMHTCSFWPAGGQTIVLVSVLLVLVYFDRHTYPSILVTTPWSFDSFI